MGLRREAEVLTAALEAGRHVVLEGPPGTGKSTLLRAVADAVGIGMVFVEGNAELTPARLVGTETMIDAVRGAMVSAMPVASGSIVSST